MMDILPSQEAQFFKAPLHPVVEMVLDIVDQHILRDRASRHGDCSCGVYVRQGKWQMHINSVIHPAVKAYIAATNASA